MTAAQANSTFHRKLTRGIYGAISLDDQNCCDMELTMLGLCVPDEYDSRSHFKLVAGGDVSNFNIAFCFGGGVLSGINPSAYSCLSEARAPLWQLWSPATSVTGHQSLSLLILLRYNASWSTSSQHTPDAAMKPRAGYEPPG